MRRMRISYDRNDVDREKIVQWLTTHAYWAKGRPAEVINQSIDNSVTISVLDDEGTFVGFGRLVTDGITFAWLCDVFADPDRRGQGIGKMVDQGAMDYFKNGEKIFFLLRTNDAHELYRRHGFEEVAGPENWMSLRLT